MSSKIVKTPYDDLTYKIIGCAMKVHRELGPSLREDNYQRAMGYALADAGLGYEAEKMISVYSQPDGLDLIGYYIPDFIVEEKIVVEIKAVQGLTNNHLAQVIGYLAVTQCPLGLLLNFAERSLRPQRIFPPTKLTDHVVNRQWLFVPDSLKNHQEVDPPTDPDM